MQPGMAGMGILVVVRGSVACGRLDGTSFSNMGRESPLGGIHHEIGDYFMKKLVAFVAAGVLASASAYGSISDNSNSDTARNYDASYAALAAATQSGGNKLAHLNAGVHAALLNNPKLKLQGYRSNFDKNLGSATFLWAQRGAQTGTAVKSLAFSPAKPELRAETAARYYLGQQASYLRLDRDNVSNARVTEVHDLGRGPIIARFQQYKDGIEVFGRSLNVMMDRNMNAVATSGYFAPAAQATAQSRSQATTSTPNFSVGAEAALAEAFADMGGKISPFAFSTLREAGGYNLYSVGKTGTDYHVVGTPRAKKVYYYTEGSYVPAWFVEVNAQTEDRATNDAYGYVVSAANGKVLFRKNLTDYDTYSYHVFAGSATPFQPEDQPINNNTLDPYTGGPSGNQGRTQGAYNLVTLQNSGLIGQLPSDSFAANDPWLAPGQTYTIGNNVVAFANIAGGDGFDPGDVRGTISSSGNFDYPYTIDSDPTTASQRQAAITNQFFVDNWLHDFWYDHGFDEASGNAQQSNYGRGGVDGDPIQAQAQDDSGRNNANMQTPPDGGSPIQRMFLWDGPLSGSSNVTVTSPAGIGALNFNTASFGPRSFTKSGNVVRVMDGGGLTNGCNAPVNSVSGAIALIDRGTCSFKTKTLNAQTAGAIAVIIADSKSHCTNPADPTTCEPAPALGDDATITTPITIGTVSLSYPDGQKIETASGTVSANVAVQFSADRDGTMDIQIVAHEFFHHVSNRLVGNATGLSSVQGGGMGEGWSDFDSMLLTVRPEDKSVGGNDKYQGAYGLALYVTFSQYFGIRRTPYSTDMSIDPLTFKDISNGEPLPTTAPILGDTTGSNNAEVHATGEIWCNTLWEIYASLLNDPRYTFLQARSRMQDYIIEGLKMTPNAPTILEARDALLAAAKATDSGDFTLMAAAFAKRGMGVDATGPDRSDPNNAGVLESYNAVAAGVQVSAAKLDFTVPSTVLGDADGDGILDPGETARLSFTVVNDGTADMAAPIIGQMTATPAGTASANVGFSSGGAVTVPALKIGESAELSVLVTLNSASMTGETLALKLNFPAANNPQGTIPAGGTAATGAELDTVVNYDLQKTSTSDNVSDTLANLGDWKLSNNGTAGPGWQILDFTGFFVDQTTSGQAWFGPDNNNASDITLQSPEADVGSSDFQMAFDHFFAFEFAGFDSHGNAFGFDGGVIEVSTDDGKTWTDAFDPSIGGKVTTGNGYNGSIFSLKADGTFDPTDSTAGHPGFVNANENPNSPVLEHIVVDFGVKLAGKNVLLRFRETSDQSTGVIGWVVDNIAFTGVTNKPFSATVPNAGVAARTPTANAGAAQTVQTGDTVMLDGSASSDPFNATLSYSWTQTGGPVVSLGGATTDKPAFMPIATGTETFQLIVTDQYGKASAPASVSITVVGPPVANPGTAQTVQVGDTVTLDGSASSDPLNTSLSYSWTQTAGPAVSLSGATTAKPTFKPASVGAVTFQLIVTNQHGKASAPALVNVTVIGIPTANAGPTQNVHTGDTVTLDGSASSDPNGSTLSYIWTQTAGPSVTLNGGTTAKPTFIPTFSSIYAFQLVVTDQLGEKSAPATVEVGVNVKAGGGGAFGLWLLLPGFALAGLRRRKRG